MLSTLSLITISMTNVAKSKWAYDEHGNNASHWADFYAECGYSRQSPIDIPLDSNTKCSEPLELQWTSEPSHYAIRNTGYSLLAMPFVIDHAGGADISGLEVLHHTNDTNIRLTNSFYHTYDSMINKEYCFDSLHFHWGSTNKDGSEHTVNGESYPLEVHLVHYSCDYPLAADALRDYSTGQSNIKYDDANVLAVIGVIFEIGKPNPVLTKILDDIIIDGIFEKNAGSDVGKLLELYYTDFDLKGLLPESREISAYLGSLTTPPCFETVRWHVLKERMTVSEEQMDKFRMLLSSDLTNDTQAPNFRPVMPLNDRTIYQCQEDIIDDAVFSDGTEKDEYFAALNAETEEETMSESEIMWKLIGIGFICLFMITLTVCMVATICLFKNWDKICNNNDKNGSNMKREKHPKIHTHHTKLEVHESEPTHCCDDNVRVIGGTN